MRVECCFYTRPGERVNKRELSCFCVLQDLKDSVRRIAQFLEKPLDAEVVEEIANRCLFKNMKKNSMSNYSGVPCELMDHTKSEFLRKGMFHLRTLKEHLNEILNLHL